MTRAYVINIPAAATATATAPILPNCKTKIPITRPFFELQNQDLAWKFVWTIPTNYANKFCNLITDLAWK